MFKFIPKYLIGLSNIKKVTILLITDTVLLIASLWISFSLRLGELYLIDSEKFSFFNGTGIIWLIIVSPAIALPIFYYFSLYKTILRFINYRTFIDLVKAVSLYTIVWGFLALISNIPEVPRSVIIINGIVTLIAICGIRFTARYFLNNAKASFLLDGTKSNTLILGSGEAGRQLAVALELGNKFRLCGFVEDSLELQGRSLMGVPVISSEDLNYFVKKFKVKDLILADPNLPRQERNVIIERLRKLKIRIRTLPKLFSFSLEGSDAGQHFDELDIEDLLAREPVVADENLLHQLVKEQIVLVTGAGGSIGGELCRQILKRKPKLLLLYELSEFALYTIHFELLQIIDELKRNTININPPKVVPILGCVQDRNKLNNIMLKYKPTIIYHAAAHKHVPMVEMNIIEGVKNNIFGTLSVIMCAIDSGVPNMVFISTDKAVRPTNIMGASKRVAEMLLQAIVSEHRILFNSASNVSKIRKTHVSIVRFGNVLGSSGSVVPLFRKQIESGGPITLTHKDVTRFFMTIPEAAQLVMQAGVLGCQDNEGQNRKNSAEVFILDMGKPIKIYDLAKRMIELSGLTIKDDANPEGDIEIIVTNLRPGEKLYEELLIGENPAETIHPRIFKAVEEFIPWPKLNLQLEKLNVRILEDDRDGVIQFLKKIVSNFDHKDRL